MKKTNNSILLFEDLDVYKLARDYSKDLSALIKKLPRNEEFNLKNQIRRAKLSVTNNIAEGFGRYHYQENIQFCRQSRGSICELIDDLNACIDEEYISTEEYDDLKAKALRLIKVLNGYIASLRRRKIASDDRSVNNAVTQ